MGGVECYGLSNDQDWDRMYLHEKNGCSYDSENVIRSWSLAKGVTVWWNTSRHLLQNVLRTFAKWTKGVCNFASHIKKEVKEGQLQAKPFEGIEEKSQPRV